MKKRKTKRRGEIAWKISIKCFKLKVEDLILHDLRAFSRFEFLSVFLSDKTQILHIAASVRSSSFRSGDLGTKQQYRIDSVNKRCAARRAWKMKSSCRSRTVICLRMQDRMRSGLRKSMHDNLTSRPTEIQRVIAVNCNCGSLFFFFQRAESDEEATGYGHGWVSKISLGIDNDDG